MLNIYTVYIKCTQTCINKSCPNSIIEMNMLYFVNGIVYTQAKITVKHFFCLVNIKAGKTPIK